MMKILLIMPPFPPKRKFPPGNHPRLFPPLGIGYIAAVLEKNGYDVIISDLYRMKWESVYPIFRDTHYDIVGISSIFPSRTSTHLLIDLIHKLHPETKIVVGGPFATVMAERLAMLPSVTAVVVGEGEVTFLELANALRDRRDISTVKGIVFREENRIIKTEPRGYIDNLDELPFPSFHLYDLKSYHRFLPDRTTLGAQFIKHRIRGISWASVIATRSCEFQCPFCAVHITCGDKPRSRSGKNVANEIEFLKREYGYKAVFLQDASFPIGNNLSQELCENLINRKIHVLWGTNARADMATEESLLLMRKAGCCFLLFGVESGSNYILNRINKKETIEQIIEAIILCNKTGIEVGIHIIVGYPGENEHTINETIALLKRLKKYIKIIHVRIVSLFPGTQLYREVISQGKFDEDYFFKPAPYFFAPYTLEHTYGILYEWKKKMLLTIKPPYSIL